LLTSSFNNSIIGNNITSNTCGIKLEGGSGNSLVGNTITNNSQGIYIITDFPNPNKIYHNNFKDNDQHVLINGANAWDNDYPSGGNYWSNYTGVDEKSGPYQNETGSDGIGDTPYTIDEYNVDKYPLMAPLSTFEAGVWNGTDLKINVITNSTVSNLEIDRDHKKVSLNVSGTSGFAGYCRITIPNIIVQELWQSSYSVLLNGDPWPFENWTDTANTYIYINYTHSEHKIVTIPEFPSTMILPPFMLTTLITTVLLMKKRKIERKLP
jgi:parallel beta-helix repeat protein